MLIEDRLVDEGGWIARNGVRCFNLYRPPEIKLGDSKAAGPWLEHLEKIYPEDCVHIALWLAHRVQRPEEKINHALVLGGAQGIGKDTILEPVKHAVGPWNFKEASPPQVMGRFNGFLKAVILRMNEARDLGEFDRYTLYDHMKPYTAAPPDVLRVDEKNLKEHSILNCCGVIITTNHKTDGVYLPPDDRRHYVAWSDYVKEDFSEEYWNKLWGWYKHGGLSHVAAWLYNTDLGDFDAKAPPPKTAAFWAIVDAGGAPEDAEFADALDALARKGEPPPNAVTVDDIRRATDSGDFREWLGDRKSMRQIPHRMEACGYLAVRSNYAKDGKWVIAGKRRVIYVRKGLSAHDQQLAAKERAERGDEGEDEVPRGEMRRRRGGFRYSED